MATKKNEKNEKEFVCYFCNYVCCYLSDWSRHVLTSKHKKLSNAIQKNEKNEPHVNCSCGNIYKHKSSYYKHKKTCTFKITNIIEEENNENLCISDKNLILTLIQQNNEIQKQMIEVIKNGTINNNTVNNNTMNNSNNNTFNLQVFLNETCKDAMNIMDFVDSIKIQLCDIESIGELGFVNGMSKLIIKHLNALDENMRPVHCNDLKRESLFVKDANVWSKEDADNNKLKKAIKYIAHKNICALPEWRKQYPDCEYSDSKKSDQYNHIVIEAMGGSGDNDDEKADKIISKIAKTITIDKKN